MGTSSSSAKRGPTTPYVPRALTEYDYTECEAAFATVIEKLPQDMVSLGRTFPLDESKDTPDFPYQLVWESLTGRAVLYAFATTEYSTENIMFLHDVERFRNLLRRTCSEYRVLSTQLLPASLGSSLLPPLQLLILEYWQPANELKDTGDSIIAKYCLSTATHQVPVSSHYTRDVIEHWPLWTLGTVIPSQLDQIPDIEPIWAPPLQLPTITKRIGQPPNKDGKDSAGAVSTPWPSAEHTDLWAQRVRSPPTPFDPHWSEITRLVCTDSFARFKQTQSYQLWAIAEDVNKQQPVLKATVRRRPAGGMKK